MAAILEPSGTARARRGGARGLVDAGFSLIEVIASLAVFALIATAVTTMVVDSLHTTRSNQARVRAASLTAQEVEAVRAGLRSGGGIGNTSTLTFPWSDPACSATSVTCTRYVDGQRFVLTRNVSALAADATHAGRLVVTTTATWDDMNGVKPVVNSTVMTGRGISPATATSDTPGSGGGASTGGTSAVTVTVTGSGNTPYAYKPVTLAGPTGSLQANTDSLGVATFTGLAAATYTASVTQTGYIDKAGNPTASVSVTTTANSTSAVALSYAQAATVNYSVTAPTGYTPGATFPISVVNTDAATTRTHTPAASTGTTTVQTWPSSTMRAWDGTCTADQNTYTSFAATAGGTVNKTLGLAGVRVTVKKTLLIIGLSPVANAQLIAVKAGDTGCPATTADPVNGGSAGSVIYFPSKTDSSGQAKVALPPGTWTIKVIAASLGLTGSLLSGWPVGALTVDSAGAGQITDVAVSLGLI